MRALICLGFRPTIDTRSAAAPVTWGAAMLVPCAPTMKVGRGAQLMSRLVWLHAAHTNASLPAGGVSGGPNELLPPGAATLITERPKLVKYAGASTSVNGPVRAKFAFGFVALASDVGPVAATQMTDGVLQKDQ